jgi:Protein of unknown function (DUF3616).
MPDLQPKATLSLRFLQPGLLRHVDDPIESDLSAATRCGDSLFLSCDETAGIDRLRPVGGSSDRHLGDHRHFALGDLVDLPGGPGGEMDIEGLACDGSWLWVVGSHSLKRKKPDVDDDTPEEALAKMARVERQPNRFFLGRLPLVETPDGFEPVARDADRRITHVKFGGTEGRLLKWLGKDRHLAPFLGIPSKENGFDVEGIAARGLRVWIGLRGPVLRGFAVVVEMEMRITKSGHLKPRRIDGRRRFRKHLLPTRGLGVRDLVLDGDDLIVLAGPTLAGDGPAQVFRWRNGAGRRASAVHPPERLDHLFELPYRGPHDHPEGLVGWGGDWLVVYDSPAPDRLDAERRSVTADLWHRSRTAAKRAA